MTYEFLYVKVLVIFWKMMQEHKSFLIKDLLGDVLACANSNEGGCKFVQKYYLDIWLYGNWCSNEYSEIVRKHQTKMYWTHRHEFQSQEDDKTSPTLDRICEKN